MKKTAVRYCISAFVSEATGVFLMRDDGVLTFVSVTPLDVFK